jgi:hypothetical protein
VILALEPLCAAILSIAFLGEPVTWNPSGAPSLPLESDWA